LKLCDEIYDIYMCVCARARARVDGDMS